MNAAPFDDPAEPTAEIQRHRRDAAVGIERGELRAGFGMNEGIAGKVELRYDQALGQLLFNGYELFSYYDIGRVWLEDAALGANDKKSLASVGFGVRSFFTDNLSSSIEVGVPMTKPVTNEGPEGKGARIFFTATARF